MAIQIPRTAAQVGAAPAAAGVPTGGASGQVLAKSSSSDYATGWVDPPSGGSGPGGDLLSPLANAEVAVSGATALSSSAFGRWHRCGGSAAYAVTLPAPSGNAGKLVGVRVVAAAGVLVTVQANASESIDGAASRPMRGGESAVLLCDGANWSKVAGRSVPMQARIRLANPGNPNVAQDITNEAVVKVLFNQVDADDTGLMADIANSRMACRRGGRYRVVAQGFFSSLTGNHTILSAKLYVNGANAGDRNYSALSGAFPSVPYIDDVALAAGDVVDLRVYVNGFPEHLYGDATGGCSFLDLAEAAPW